MLNLLETDWAVNHSKRVAIFIHDISHVFWSEKLMAQVRIVFKDGLIQHLSKNWSIFMEQSNTSYSYKLPGFFFLCKRIGHLYQATEARVFCQVSVMWQDKVLNLLSKEETTTSLISGSCATGTTFQCFEARATEKVAWRAGQTEGRS